jgi:plasmid stabilization system protein ParE
MDRLIWSPQAASDLQGICEFIGRDSPVYARLQAQRILSVVESLPRFPRSGRMVPEIDDPLLRERIVGPYRVIYRLKTDAIEIVTVLHGARRLRL